MAVFRDMETGKDRCINGLHVQTFVPSPLQKGTTLITFASGDNVTVADDFDTVYMIFAGIVDG
jgi:hypothetical protein